MPGLTISEVARRAGLRPSAIRYYERIGILDAPPRVAGRRSYDPGVLHWLAVISRSRRLGFSLDRIRQLFFAFDASVPAGPRWRAVADDRLAEVNALIAELGGVRAQLEAQGQCDCASLSECGRCMVENENGLTGGTC